MKKLLLAGVAALFLATGSTHAADKCVNPDGTQDPVCAERNDEGLGGEPRQEWPRLLPQAHLHWVGSTGHTRCVGTRRVVPLVW